MHKLEEAQDNNFVTCQKPKEDRLDLLHMNLHSGEFIPLHSVAFGLFWIVSYYHLSIFVVNLAPTCSFFSVKVGKVKIGPRSYVGMYFQPLSLQLQILGMHLRIHRKKSLIFFHRNKIG